MGRAVEEAGPRATLTAAEQRLADLVRLSPDAVLVLRDERVELANLAALELFGVAAPSELVGRSPLEWIDEADHAPLRARGRRVLAGEPEGPRPLFTVRRADGTARRVDGAAAAFRDDRGPALQLVLRDVTERERAEAELREAHRHTTDLLESITDAFYGVDAAWRVTYVNRRAEEQWQRTRQEVVGRELWALFPDHRDGPGAEALRRAMRERAPVHVEVHSAFLGRWVETFAYPSADGGLSVFFSDITVRKRAEAAARENALRARARSAELQAVLDTVPAVVWIVPGGGAGTCTTNRHGALLLRLAGAEGGAEGLRLERAGRPLGPGEHPVLEAARRGEAVRDAELEVVLADGGRRHLLGNASPLPDLGGGAPGAVGAFIDVTDLKVSQALLRQADRLKEDFIAMASHEFRSPLTALRLQAELLRRGLLAGAPDAAALERSLLVVDAQVDRLEALLGTLLDVSRLGAGCLALDVGEFDLAALAGEVVERHAAEAAAAGTRIRLAPGPAVGRWDRCRLDQVITNLVGNAIKYGAGRPIEVAVRADAGAATLVVRDEGIGIAPEQLDAVFERFERAGNAVHLPGLGLGLWITRKLVEAHGGAIAVESAPGRGTTFSVTLPRSPSSPAPHRAPP